jgi:hypothetical protein
MTTSDTTRVEWIAAIKIIKLPDETAGLRDDGTNGRTPLPTPFRQQVWPFAPPI